MTKEVLLAITGMQFDLTAEESNIQTITAAEYYERNNSRYVLFEETDEESGQKTKGMLKFKDNLLEVTKSGFVNVHMIFEENKKSLTDYATLFGNILIGIDTRKITLTEEEHKICLDVEYALEANYEFLADCKINIEISERES
ncbi:MAG: DUF1934 domain-containing protein [Lachnospiraceae bacterium]|nr:DUF1934 domain-containing protein [Lachnospiraceae bacterium]